MAWIPGVTGFEPGSKHRWKDEKRKRAGDGMRSAYLRAAAALILTLLTSSSAAPRECCEPPGDADLDTLEHFRECTCLRDNKPLVRERVGPGESRHYHWRLSDWTLINRPDSERPPIHLRLEPCTGSPELYVMPLWTPFPSREYYRWNATKAKGELNFVEVPLHYADYYVTVTSDRNATYVISAMTDLSLLSPAPSPAGSRRRLQEEAVAGGAAGSNATVSAAAAATASDDVLSMAQLGPALVSVTWKTTPDEGASYQLFYQKYDNGSRPAENGCGDGPNATVDSCVLWTACGLEDHGISSDEGGYEEFAPGSLATKEISELELDARYFFNVAIKSKDGLLTSYAGITAVTEFKKKTEAVDRSVTYILYAVSGTLFVLLATGVLVAKFRLNQAYKLKPGKFGFREKDVNWHQVKEQRRAQRQTSKGRAKEGKQRPPPPPGPRR